MRRAGLQRVAQVSSPGLGRVRPAIPGTARNLPSAARRFAAASGAAVPARLPRGQGAGRPHRRQLRCRDAGSHRAVGRRQGDRRFSAGRLEGLGSTRLELTSCWRSLYILTG